MVKLRLYGWQIRVNIRVVVFQVTENGNGGAVMDEFGALVKKCGVVFIGLDDKELFPVTG